MRLDDLTAGHLAADYLVQLGHRRIGHIGGATFSVGSLRQGFAKALRSHGLDNCPAEWIAKATLDLNGEERSCGDCYT